MPSWTEDGVFGMARTIGMFEPSPRSMSAIGNGRGDREDGLVGLDRAVQLGQQPFDVLRLHGDHDDLGALDGGLVVARGLDAVPLADADEPVLPARGRDDLLRRAPVGEQKAGDQGLPDLAGAEDCDFSGHWASKPIAAARGRKAREGLARRGIPPFASPDHDAGDRGCSYEPGGERDPAPRGVALGRRRLRGHCLGRGRVRRRGRRRRNFSRLGHGHGFRCGFRLRVVGRSEQESEGAPEVLVLRRFFGRVRGNRVRRRRLGRHRVGRLGFRFGRCP